MTAVLADTVSCLGKQVGSLHCSGTPDAGPSLLISKYANIMMYVAQTIMPAAEAV